MMSSGCRFSVDAHSPARATYVNLYQWPESDVEFINSMTSTTVGGGGGGGERKTALQSSSRKRRYSSRQMYLRSYVFTTKPETVPQRSRRCLGKFKKQASLLLGGGDDDGVDQIKIGNKKKKKKVCACAVVVVRRMREAARSLFGRLLPCATNNVDEGRRSVFS